MVVFVGVGITFITFFIAQVIPIDPAAAALGENAREEQIREFRERYGLDKPLLVQYGIYLQRLLHLDLGRSLRTGRPVAEDLREFFPAKPARQEAHAHAQKSWPEGPPRSPPQG